MCIYPILSVGVLLMITVNAEMFATSKNCVFARFPDDRKNYTAIIIQPNKATPNIKPRATV